MLLTVLTAALGHVAAMQGPGLGSELVANGGFEEGTAAWSFTGPSDDRVGPDGSLGAELDADKPYEGHASLRIDTRGRNSEINAVSDPVDVQAGAKYRLSSRVLLLSDNPCGFKVTIEWLDARGRHIAYANDWAGHVAGGEWVEHGGDFTAPPGATQAQLLLGIPPGAAVLFDAVSLRVIRPRVEVAALGANHAVCTPNEPAFVRCTVRNSGGETAIAVRGSLTAFGESLYCPAGDLEPGEERTFTLGIRPTAEGVARVEARFDSDNGGSARGSAPIVVAEPSDASAHKLRSGQAELRFRAGPEGYGVTDIAYVRDGRSTVVGLLRSHAALWVDGADGWTLIYAPLARMADTVSSTWEGEACDISVTYEPADPGWFTVRCVLRAKREFGLRALVFPEVHFGAGFVGAAKDSALFCGLEYLTADEQSSGTESVVTDLAARFVPHPNKVTVPLMAVAADGIAAGIAWDPLRRWDGTRDRPCAVFASPNRLDGQDSHLMALSVPTIPEFVDENARLAARPYPLRTGDRISMRAEIFVVPAPRNVCDVLPAWYRTHELAPLPETEGDHQDHWRTAIEGIMRGWDSERMGWRPEAHREHGFYPDIALRLYNYGIRHADPTAEAALSQVHVAVAKAVSERGPGALGLPLALHLGHVHESLGNLGPFSADLATQRSDGSWPFAPSEETASLGRAGDTALGICAEPTLRLLTAARLTGDDRCLVAGLRGLDYMERAFSRPAGGETWEVPLHAPNLRAAALAVECGVTAYELTGDGRHLDTARYWARSGLPFIYTWNASDREAMRYASISVFGATFYTWPWFGRAVQWVGMVYSRALQRLAPHDPTFPWAHIAEGIVISCIQQERMAERPEAGNPWPGAFPDAYDLVRGTVHGAWIGPQSIVESLEILQRAQPTSQAIVGPGIRLVSAAEILTADHDGEHLGAVLRYPAGLTCHSVLACIARPAAVLVDGERIPEVADLEQVPSGWTADTLRNYLIVKHPSADGTIPVVIEGARYAQTDLWAVRGELANAGFEDGVLGWSGQGTSAAEGARSGTLCLLLDASQSPTEHQMTSDPVRVQGGATYILEAWVRVASEHTGYKVTVDWLDAEGRHIGYDNDWRGSDRPTEWSRHGGIFSAPPDAAQARLILGVRPGVRALFDDLSLVPQ